MIHALLFLQPTPLPVPASLRPLLPDIVVDGKHLPPAVALPHHSRRRTPLRVPGESFDTEYAYCTHCINSSDLPPPRILHPSAPRSPPAPRPPPPSTPIPRQPIVAALDVPPSTSQVTVQQDTVQYETDTIIQEEVLLIQETPKPAPVPEFKPHSYSKRERKRKRRKMRKQVKKKWVMKYPEAVETVGHMEDSPTAPETCKIVPVPSPSSPTPPSPSFTCENPKPVNPEYTSDQWEWHTPEEQQGKTFNELWESSW